MYGRKKVKEECEANILRLRQESDSEATKRFEENPIKLELLTISRLTWRMAYGIFGFGQNQKVKSKGRRQGWKGEVRSQGGRPHLAQFPRHWPAPMSGYWADLGKARRQQSGHWWSSQAAPPPPGYSKLDRLHTGFSSQLLTALSPPSLSCLYHTNITQCNAQCHSLLFYLTRSLHLLYICSPPILELSKSLIICAAELFALFVLLCTAMHWRIEQNKRSKHLSCTNDCNAGHRLHFLAPFQKFLTHSLFLPPLC